MENQAAHPYQEFPRVPQPGFNGVELGNETSVVFLFLETKPESRQS